MGSIPFRVFFSGPPCINILNVFTSKSCSGNDVVQWRIGGGGGAAGDDDDDDDNDDDDDVDDEYTLL